jgi:uncharacterized protein YbcI
MSGISPETHRDRSPAAQISSLVVQLVRSYTGRGPTKAWTSIDGDLVSVVLRDTLTRGEQSLLADDGAQLVLEVRKAYQMTMRSDLVAAVESVLGRKVIAFMSDNHIDPDIQIESFVLEPLEASEAQPPHAA